VLWANRNAETEAPLEAFLQHDTVRAIHTTGHADPSKISPDNWNMDLFFLARSNAHRAQLDLFYDYRTNAALCSRRSATTPSNLVVPHCRPHPVDATCLDGARPDRDGHARR
jgi:hypothetical protein